jgi:H2-forming N5,N10-methylenetetrahydromethanopterin dehydrogenase-like enzyme
MQIMTFKEIVDNLAWRIMDASEPMEEDKIINTLLGLSEMIDTHNMKMMDTLSQAFSLSGYRQLKELKETDSMSLGDLLKQRLNEGKLND